MRRFTKIAGRVFYGTNATLVPTAIEDVSATRFGSNVGFVVNVPDAVRVLVLFRDASAPVNGSIRWKPVELTNGGSGSRWTGGSPIVGTNIEWLVQALTAQGNVATSSNKARYFDASPAQTGGGITISAHRCDGVAGRLLRRAPVNVSADRRQRRASSLMRRLDGETPTGYARRHDHPRHGRRPSHHPVRRAPTARQRPARS